MNTGVEARLDRISADGRYLVIPMDHGITMGAVDGLANIESTIDGVTSGGATAVLTQKGIAPRVHEHKNGAGYVVHLNGSTTLGPDENDKRLTGTVEDAIRAGADAVSFHINVGSTYEREQIEELGDVTTTAAEYGMPVLAMTYARGPDVADRTDPDAYAEDVAHAVRLGEELGADVVKTSYTGTPESFERVVDATRLPVVIAGGSKGSDRETLETVAGAMNAGAAGVSTGRSVFQHEDPRAITEGIAAVIEDGETPEAAAREAGLPVEA